MVSVGEFFIGLCLGMLGLHQCFALYCFVCGEPPSRCAKYQLTWFTEPTLGSKVSNLLTILFSGLLEYWYYKYRRKTKMKQRLMVFRNSLLILPLYCILIFSL